MKYISRVVLPALIMFTIACSGSKQVATNSSSSANSVYPTWYGGFEFNSDSTSFTSRATAVAGDAETAKMRAEKEARALLESYIAKELEDVRSELERDGSDIVRNPEFILMLRNAHAKIEQEATIVNTESMSNDGVFRGFAKVEISKEQVKLFIEEGLSTKRAYQREFTNSQSFKELVAG